MAKAGTPRPCILFEKPDSLNYGDHEAFAFTLEANASPAPKTPLPSRLPNTSLFGSCFPGFSPDENPHEYRIMHLSLIALFPRCAVFPTAIPQPNTYTT